MGLLTAEMDSDPRALATGPEREMEEMDEMDVLVDARRGFGREDWEEAGRVMVERVVEAFMEFREEEREGVADDA